MLKNSGVVTITAETIKKEEKINKNIYDELNTNFDKVSNKNKNLKIVSTILGFLLIAVIGAWTQLHVSLSVTNSLSVTIASISFLTVIIVLGLVFGTGIGGEVLRRFKNRLMFNSGKYVNTLYVTKNGVVQEKFKKVDNVTGSFKVNDKSYTRNPSLLYRFKKLPTYFHREGNPDPIDPFAKDFTTEMSEAEIDQVMASKASFDFKQWLTDNALIIFIVLAVVVVVGAVSGYFGFMIEQMLREGTYAAVECVKPSVALNASSIV